MPSISGERMVAKDTQWPTETVRRSFHIGQKRKWTSGDELILRLPYAASHV